MLVKLTIDGRSMRCNAVGAVKGGKLYYKHVNRDGVESDTVFDVPVATAKQWQKEAKSNSKRIESYSCPSHSVPWFICEEATNLVRICPYTHCYVWYS